MGQALPPPLLAQNTTIRGEENADITSRAPLGFKVDTDPTEGYVTYVDQSTASSASLISTSNNTVYMGVDSTNVASGSGRKSVRITSKNSYDTGLVILDLEHMPGSICGTWPAFWMVGPDWPTTGEIDIIEGVNTQVGNAMTLHTGSECSISDDVTMYGSIETSDCYVYASGQTENAGCGITTSSSASYGDGFNAVDGGVYATEITSEGISIWNFDRSSIPSDISSGSPDPSGWGEATASFSGSCDFSSNFESLQIVFDTTFCGTWAGTVWSSDSTGWGWGNGHPSRTHVNEGEFYAATTPTTLETAPAQKRDTATSAPEEDVVEDSSVVKAMAKEKRSIADSQDGLSEKAHRHVLEHKRSHGIRRAWQA
ncbi:hypothetical protein DV737_g2635, partial [Chaetothyriales sp. CBS 132003]